MTIHSQLNFIQPSTQWLHQIIQTGVILIQSNITMAKAVTLWYWFRSYYMHAFECHVFIFSWKVYATEMLSQQDCTCSIEFYCTWYTKASPNSLVGYHHDTAQYHINRANVFTLRYLFSYYCMHNFQCHDFSFLRKYMILICFSTC